MLSRIRVFFALKVDIDKLKCSDHADLAVVIDDVADELVEVFLVELEKIACLCDTGVLSLNGFDEDFIGDFSDDVCGVT